MAFMTAFPTKIACFLAFRRCRIGAVAVSLRAVVVPFGAVEVRFGAVEVPLGAVEVRFGAVARRQMATSVALSSSRCARNRWTSPGRDVWGRGGRFGEPLVGSVLP